MIGDLRHRITLQRPVRTADDAGGFITTWSNLERLPTVYAAVEPLSGGERYRFGQMETVITHRITLRYRADVTPEMRVVHQRKAYDIVSVENRGGLGIWSDLLAVETASSTPL